MSPTGSHAHAIKLATIHATAALLRCYNAPMPRPRFQFRLRTLFVVVTIAAVACAYVAHEWRIVQARKAWLSNHNYKTARMWDFGSTKMVVVGERNATADPPPIRRWLGDQAVEMIIVDPGPDVQQVQTFFPEARIIFYSLE